MLDASRQGFERELGAAQLGALPAIWSCSGEAGEQPAARERPELAAQRLGSRDEQVAQLAKRSGARAHRPFACRDQRAKSLTLARAPRCGGPLLSERAPGCADRVERVGLAARAAFAAQAADLEHLLPF